jgi:hypothetical protein
MKKVLLDQDNKILGKVEIEVGNNYVGYDNWVQLTDAQSVQLSSLYISEIDYITQMKLKVYQPFYDYYLINDQIERRLNLSKCISIKQQLIKSACSNEIISGFKSSALGTEHTYPSNETDQKNLNGCITSSLLHTSDPTWTINFWCADTTGNWEFTAHTAEQIQQVGMDCINFIQLQQNRCNQLITQLSSATTEAEFDAIVWKN